MYHNIPLVKCIVVLCILLAVKHNIVYGILLAALAAAYYQELDIRDITAANIDEINRRDRIQSALFDNPMIPIIESRDAFFQYNIPTAAERGYLPA